MKLLETGFRKDKGESRNIIKTHIQGGQGQLREGGEERGRKIGGY